MSAAPIEIELYYDTDCPNAPSVRRQLLACLGEQDADWQLHEYRDAGRLSPTVFVDSVDVRSPRPPSAGCRLDLPARDHLCRALDAAAASRG